jgi:multiple sugar transport system substrate-binding protein
MADNRERVGRRNFTRREALKAFGMGATALSLSSCGFTLGKPSITVLQAQGKEAAAGRKTVIELYNIFGGTDNIHWIQLAERFEQAQQDIGIKITYAPPGSSGGGDNPKLLTAIAAGHPPDLAQITPFSTPQFASLGVMTDLTPYLQREGLGADDFFTAAWNDMNWQGKVWQVQWDADANFPFFWNKQVFEDAGLDPNTPPKTIEEVDEFSRKINKQTSKNISRIGLIPWDNYGFSNSLFTWGWAFGGEFYDREKQVVTPDNEYVVKALEWMANYAKNAGGADKLAVSPPNLQLHVFSTGNVAMAPIVASQYRSMVQAKPDMKIGATLLPFQGPGATAPGAGGWLGGWSLFIPKGAKNPDAAWEFIKWVSVTDQGLRAAWETVGFPPAYRKAPVLEDIKNDPVMGPYYTTLVNAKHSRPAIPVGAFYTGILDQFVSDAIYGQITPLAAMKQAKALTMKEWERFNREHGL